jgi:GTPase SAR1 family protein
MNLAAFVDRKTELARFCDMLESDEKPIMVVWGEEGIGKSSFLARLIHECSTRQLRKAEVFATKDRFNTSLKIMRKIRDDLGAEFFPKFTQLVNYFFPDPTQPLPMPVININVTGAQSVLEGAKLENVTIGGDVAGVIVKDLMINVARSDMDTPPRDRVIMLTDAFIENLAPVLQEQMLVILFDDIQELTEETYAWLWEELVRAAGSGRLKNVRFVLCGQTKPELKGNARMMVKEAPLGPLAVDDVDNYLARSGLRAEPNDRRMIAEWLHNSTEGIPGEVAVEVDRYFLKHPDKQVPLNG